MQQIVLPVIYTVLQLAVPVVLGFVSRRRMGLSAEGYSAFGRLVVTLTLPLYFFVRTSRIDPALITRAAIFPFAAIIVVGFGSVASYAAGRAIFRGSDRADSERRRLVTAMGGFGNSGYMPLSVHELLPLTLPAVVSFFGVELPPLYVGAYLLVQSPMLWSVGNYLVTGRRGKFQLRTIISPPIYGIVLGLIANRLGLADRAAMDGHALFFVWYALETVGNVTVPLVLITLGGLIAGIRLPEAGGRSPWKVAIVVTAMRMAVVPGLFWLVFTVTEGLSFLGPAAVFVLFLETHTPTASNFTVMSARTGRNQNEVALTLMAGYLTYLLIFPVYLYLFLTTAIPR